MLHSSQDNNTSYLHTYKDKRGQKRITLSIDQNVFMSKKIKWVILVYILSGDSDNKIVIQRSN